MMVGNHQQTMRECRCSCNHKVRKKVESDKVLNKISNSN